MDPNIDQQPEKLTATRKALLINLDPKIFGTFAEIGAGQEVGRYFFRVAGAANTIAKSMSAYDMTFSDHIYGKATRYVSRERLEAMLEHEYSLLLERLSAKRGSESTFFVFADTVAARSARSPGECHGWLGVRYQLAPQETPNEIIMHVRMTDTQNILQQEALGIVGVNLLYAAFFYSRDINMFIKSLLDDLTSSRIEVDFLEFSGPHFSHVDNRIANLRLVRENLTDAVIFPPEGRAVQPSELLYSRPIILERGRFQPVTHVHVDMLEQAKRKVAELKTSEKEPVVLCEISLNRLGDKEQLKDEQLLAHTEMLAALGYTVMLSSHPEFYRLVSFFRRYTKERITVVAGVDILARLFIEEDYYTGLSGGILEGLGRLFQKDVMLFAYPMTKEKYLAILSRTVSSKSLLGNPTDLPGVMASRDVHVTPLHRQLLNYLIDSGAICDIKSSCDEYQDIDSVDVLNKIRAGDPTWEQAVPREAALVINKKGFAM